MLIALGALLVLGGCATSAEDRLVGIWTADSSKTTLPPIPIPGAEKRVQDFIQSVTLKLRSDKTFVFTAGASVEGTWSLLENKIKLLPNKSGLTGPFGNLATDLTGIPGADYKSMTVNQPTPFGDVGIAFKKTG